MIELLKLLTAWIRGEAPLRPLLHHWLDGQDPDQPIPYTTPKTHQRRT